MKIATALTLIALGAVTAPVATAAEEAAPARRWSDEAELSYVETGGNTVVKTLSVKNTLNYRFSSDLSGSWRASILRGETDGVMTAERYTTDLRLDYRVSERSYAYLTAGWLKDEFAGIESSTSTGPGAGYRFLKGPRHRLVGEAGLQYLHEYYTTGAEDDHIDGRLFGGYEFAFAEKSKFVQSLEYLHDFDDADNYRVNTETALVTTLTSLLSMKVGYTVRYDNRPVPDTLRRTDTLLSVALIANL